MATQDTGAPGAADPDSEEEAGSATPASLADIAPGADEALSTAAAARAGTTLQAGDVAGALAAADQVTQAAALARRLVRHAGRRGSPVGTPPGELRGLVAAHLAAYPAEDFGLHATGRVLGRSSEAVANALDRLAAIGQAQLTSEAPRRYRHASPPATVG